MDFRTYIELSSSFY